MCSSIDCTRILQSNKARDRFVQAETQLTANRNIYPICLYGSNSNEVSFSDKHGNNFQSALPEETGHLHVLGSRGIRPEAGARRCQRDGRGEDTLGFDGQQMASDSHQVTAFVYS